MIFLEYAIDVAQACRERGIKNVAVSAGYMCAAPRAEFYAHMDAANIDLKGFTEGFYKKLCTGALQPVLDTLEYLKHETDVWLEITTLLIPGHNDGPAEIEELSAWVMDHLGPDVPLHFTAFHPDYKMMDSRPRRPRRSIRAREIASATACTTSTPATSTTRPARARTATPAATRLIGRDWYEITAWHLTPEGAARRAVRLAPACSRPARHLGPAPHAGAGGRRCGHDLSLSGATYRSSSSSAFASSGSAQSRPW